jgi:hypothetical protein
MMNIIEVLNAWNKINLSFMHGIIHHPKYAISIVKVHLNYFKLNQLS